MPRESFKRTSSQMWVNLWPPPWSSNQFPNPKVNSFWQKWWFSNFSHWNCFFRGSLGFYLSAWAASNKGRYLIICKISTLWEWEKFLNLHSISQVRKAVTHGQELIKDFVFQQLEQNPCKSGIMRENLREPCSLHLFIFLQLRHR